MKTADDAARLMEDERGALIAAIMDAAGWKRGKEGAGQIADAVLMFYETKHDRAFKRWEERLEHAERALKEEQHINAGHIREINGLRDGLGAMRDSFARSSTDEENSLRTRLGEADEEIARLKTRTWTDAEKLREAEQRGRAQLEAIRKYHDLWTLCHEREEPPSADLIVALGYARGELFAALTPGALSAPPPGDQG